MKKIKCRVIVCGPAVGKTYLAKHDDKFVDIDGIKADYKYNLYDVSEKEKERGKLNRGKVHKTDSSQYAIKLLLDTFNNKKIALLSYHEKLINFLIENEIEYCLVYADKCLRKEYAERMRKRGNTENFIEQMTSENAWNNFYEENEFDNKPKYKIKLKKGQYLSDIKDLFI